MVSPGFAVNLVFLLDHNRKTSASGCVTKNVANVVVTKQQRRAVVAARSVIPKDIHHIPAHLALTRQRRTRIGLAEKWHAEAKLESRAKDV